LIGLRLGMAAALGYELILRGGLAEGSDLVAALGPLARQGTASPFIGSWWLAT
jgi:hypothetical protein